MEKFTKIESIAAPIGQSNIDTDQIIPARFLRKPRKEGVAPYLFHDLRFDQDGEERPDFILNRAPYRDARIIVSERNFGCGSSREHAVYALYDFGVRAVIAPSFGDIFFNNCLQNGLLPVVLAESCVADLLRQLLAKPGMRISVDLVSQTVIGADGGKTGFEINPFRKQCLLEGTDEIGFTRNLESEITAFEKRYCREFD